MNFISLEYGYFLLLLIVLYYFLPKTFQKYVLLLFSVLFYLSYSEKAFVCMLASGILTYVFARGISSAKQLKKRKIYLAIAIISNMCILLLFHTGIAERYSLVLPLGISFYTLSVSGYLIDVYRKTISVEKNFLDLFLFESFFPHILQGPIARYGQLSPQFKKVHVFQYTQFCYGLQLMLWGYIKKMVIADRAAIYVDVIYQNCYTVSGTELFVASLLYSLTIFADFSGCVDIARGTAAVFGVELTENFRQPYLAVSIQDFWRRWHISLSTWFRDYIYIPLGGNRKGKLRKWINLFVVFFVSGVWHGAGVNFLIWSMLHGFYQMAGALLHGAREKIYKLLHLSRQEIFSRGIQVFITFQLVNLAWIFFRVTDVRQACYIIKTILWYPNLGILFDGSLAEYGGVTMKDFYILVIFTLVLFAVEIINYRGICIREAVGRQRLTVRWFIYMLGIFSVVIWGIYGKGYNASDFIYMKF